MEHNERRKTLSTLFDCVPSCIAIEIFGLFADCISWIYEKLLKLLCLVCSFSLLFSHSDKMISVKNVTQLLRTECVKSAVALLFDFDLFCATKRTQNKVKKKNSKVRTKTFALMSCLSRNSSQVNGVWYALWALLSCYCFFFFFFLLFACHSFLSFRFAHKQNTYTFIWR